MSEPEVNLDDLSKDEIVGLINEHEKVFLVNKLVKIGFVVAIGFMILLAL